MGRTPDPRLVRAKARLDALGWWPRPVRIGRVRIFVTPWFFRLPWFRRFDGHAFHLGMLLRDASASDDLITHELCHVWQMQHRPVRMPLSYLVRGYWSNPYEIQARAAVTRGSRLQPGTAAPNGSGPRPDSAVHPRRDS